MKHTAKTGSFCIACVLIVFLMARCAHQGSLSGGPKDVVPPASLEAVPPDRTTRFQANRITITFNEFIQLKDPGKEIFMSPPMKEKPEFKVHGKDLLIQFKEPLKENSTYTINFGNSVADYTEGNVLPNFEYVFSTGDVIDSLFIEGRVLNSFDLKPEPDMMAMVYTDDHDSLPLDSLPLHVPPKSASRTDKEGNFRINNLPPGKYLLIALQDLNNNFYYDLPNERFAFLDSLVTLLPPDIDSAEAVYSDTAVEVNYGMSVTSGTNYELYMFELADTTQKLLGKKRIGTNRLQYAFRTPLDTIEISLVDYTPSRPDWYLPEYSRKRDTLDLWLRPGLPDTIRVRIFTGDSIIDTSRFILTQPERTVLKQKKEEVHFAKFSANIKAGSFDLNQEFRLMFSSPLLAFDTARILLKSSSDSLSPSLSFSDSIQRSVIVHHQWKQGESYKITVYDSAFTDQAGHVNDSTTLGFKVRSVEDYGILILKLELPEGNGQYIIQLLNQADVLLNEQMVSISTTLRFEYLLPGKYKLKAIRDENANGRWNPGNYRKKLVPEGVQFYPGEISIRSNWELQEDWKIKAR